MITLPHRVIRRIRREVLPLWHATGTFWCPVCDHAVRRFEPLPRRIREQWKIHGFDLDPEHFETLNLASYSCPLCTVSDRDRLYALYLQQFVAPHSPHGRIVEFAPIGELSSAIRRTLPGWEHRTADLFMPNVDDRVDLCNMRGTYADDSVDLFLCSHVLEHVSSEQKALCELFRILKRGGRGIMMVPIHLDLTTSRDGSPDMPESERWRHFGQGDHARLHSRQDFIAHVCRAGFRLEQLTAVHFGSAAMQGHGISHSSVLYVGHKP